MEVHTQCIEAADNGDIEAIERIEKRIRLPENTHLWMAIPIWCLSLRMYNTNYKLSHSDILITLCESFRVYEYLNSNHQILDSIMIHASIHDKFMRSLYENASDLIRDRMVKNFDYSP